MSNSGRKMSTSGWCTFAALGVIFAAALGNVGYAEPPHTSKMSTLPAAKTLNNNGLMLTTVRSQAVKSPTGDPTSYTRISDMGNSHTTGIGSSEPESKTSRPLFLTTEAGASNAPGGSRQAMGGVVEFFLDDASFQTALDAAGKILKVEEDFEEAVLDPNDSATTCDPLDTSCDDGIFSPGDIPANLAFQSNVSDPGLTPGIGSGYVLVTTGFNDALNNATGADVFAESTDIMSIGPDNHTAMGMQVLDLRNGQPINIRIFDKNENLLGMTTVPGPIPAGSFLGVLVTGGSIGRINLSAQLVGAETIYDLQAYLDDPCTVDGKCGEGENNCNCPGECDPAPVPCGDGVCCAADAEDCATCPEDCGVCPFCGDNNIDSGEDCDPPGSLCPNGTTCDADCSCPPLGGCCVDGACIGDVVEVECIGNWSANSSCSGVDDLPVPICNTGCSWDNGLPLDDQGAPATQFDPDPGGFAAGAADDFILKDAGINPCEIHHITAWTSHFNPGTATPNDYTGVNVTVYGDADPKGPGGQPEDDGTHSGDVIVTLTIPIAEVTFIQEPTVCNTNIWRLDMDVDFLLPKNVKMWLEIQPIMPFSGIGQSAFALSENSTGHPAQQIFEALGLPWTVISGNQDDCPPDTEPEGTRRDLAFQLIGGKVCDGNGTCDGHETSCNCPSDCGGPCVGTCIEGICCGDGVVDENEECDFGVLDCGTCPWDASGDGDVGAFDLALLLGNWGPIAPNANPEIFCLDAHDPPDDELGAFDLANLLGNWGECPVGFSGPGQCVEGDCLSNCKCIGRGGCCDTKGPGTCDGDKTAGECANLGGIYLGDDTLCDDCPSPVCTNAEGDCCAAAGNGTPGCDDPECCGLVCNAGPDGAFCCDEEWDSLCAAIAADLCGCPIPLDDCALPEEIFDGETTFSTVGATTDGLDTNCLGDCCAFGPEGIENDIWYTYTATCDGLLTLDTCGTVDYDSKIAVYEGCDVALCPRGGDEIGCNDDGPGCPGFSTIATAVVVQNSCYMIRIGGFSGGDSGSGTVNVTCEVIGECGDQSVGPLEDCDPPGSFCPSGADETLFCNQLCECPQCELSASTCDGSEIAFQSCPLNGAVADDDPNGGCNSVPFAFDTIACNETLCGEVGNYIEAGGGMFRDIDWFEFELTATADVTLTAVSEIVNLQFGLYDTDQGSCAVVDEIVGSSTALGCVPNSVTAILDPGIWVVLVTTPFFEGQPCPGENEYQVTLTVDPPAACP